jgi:transcriptional regulator with XRE-family HTH domain
VPSGDFAERLTQCMREQHLSVAKFHKELGGAVGERTIWRWRSGEAVPGIEALPFLARALNTTPNQLVGWEEGDA